MKREHGIFLIGVCCLVMLGEGCAVMSNYHELVFLKQLADNQSETEKYVRKQERGFDALRSDIENSSLRKGSTKAEIIFRYGDPVYCNDSADTSDCRQSCLYRYPTAYFNSDKIFLCFDENHDLRGWESVPGVKPLPSE